MFPLGVFFLAFGYAAVYTAAANIRNGGQGPRLLESMGFRIAVAPPGADSPNLTGQPNVGTSSVDHSGEIRAAS